jgi:hypothetical protein
MFIFGLAGTEFAVSAAPDFAAPSTPIAFSHGAQSYEKNLIQAARSGANRSSTSASVIRIWA